MVDGAKQQIWINRIRRIILYAVAVILFLLAMTVVSLKIYLTTPYPSRQLSLLLSSYLHQPVTVKALHISGTTISLFGLTVTDPTGFSDRKLLEAVSVSISPDYGQLLKGRRQLRLIELDGLKLDLHKNSNGTWNIAELRKLSSRPSSGAETIVRRISLRSGSISAEGRNLNEISLEVLDLATKGTLESSIDLSFRDTAGNRFLLGGKARLGSNPSFNLNLKGESLHFGGLAVKGTLKEPLAHATGNLNLAAILQDGLLTAEGGMGVNRIRAYGRSGQLDGRLVFKARYNLRSDQADLESLDLIVDDLPQLHSSGSITGLKSERKFHMQIRADDLDLQRLSQFLPVGREGDMKPAGRIGSATLLIAGSASKGISSINGGAQVYRFSLRQGDRLLVNNLSGNVGLVKSGTGMVISGDISSQGGSGALLESIQAPFNVRLSSKLKPLHADISLKECRISGVSLSGRAGYESAGKEPLSFSVHGSCDDLASSAARLGQKGLGLAAGRGTLFLKGVGKGALEFSAASDIRVSEVRTVRGGSNISIDSGTITSMITRRKGILAIEGKSVLDGMNAAGKNGQARFDYRLSNNILNIENTVMELDGMRLFLSSVRAPLSPVSKAGGFVSYPVVMEFSDGEVRHNSAEVHGLAGRMNGKLVKSPAGNWLEGTAELTATGVERQGKPVAVLQSNFTFDRTGARCQFGGSVLKGDLKGTARFNPFSPANGIVYVVEIKGADMASSTPFLPSKAGASISAGKLDCRLDGSYSAKAGLRAVAEAGGTGITLNKSGKSMVSRAGVTVSAFLEGDRLTIRKGAVTAGEGINATAVGTLEQPFTNKRHGRLELSLAEAPLNSHIDAFINAMPRILQEAAVDGTLAANATLDMEEGKSLLQGELLLNHITIDSPGQGLDIYGLNGIVPFSVGLSGKGPAHVRNDLDFTRGNFRQLYSRLGLVPSGGRNVSIDRISLGSIELGPVEMNVRAADGLTQIASLRSRLYEGTLLGIGSIYLENGLKYRGDLLLNELSLTDLCSRFPAIKGYISGRVNGIVSLYSEASGLSGLYGFVDFWASEAQGENMHVSREFLQKLGGKKMGGVFFRQNLPYDRARISAVLERGDLTFDRLDIVHTNMFGVRDLNVSVAPSQNRIALDHLIDSIKQASKSGKAASGQGKEKPQEAPQSEFKWEE